MDEITKGLREPITKFEEEYGMESEEFKKRLEEGAMGDDADFIEWSATIDMLANMDRKESMR